MDATCLWYYIRPNLKNAVSVEIMDKLDDMWKNGWLGCAGKKWEKTLKPRHTLTVASPAKTWWGFWNPVAICMVRATSIIIFILWSILECDWYLQKVWNCDGVFKNPVTIWGICSCPRCDWYFQSLREKPVIPIFKTKKPRHTLSYKTKTPSHFDLQKWKPRHNLTYEKQFHLQKRILDSIKLSEIVLWDYNMDNLKRKNRKLF